MKIFILFSFLAMVLSASAGCKGKNICNLPIESGPGDENIPRWGFDSEEGCCVKFIYGGCHGNKNNFETKKECEKACVCNLPAERGPCDGKYKRWAYDSNKKKCKKFTYGGCDGNANNFKLKKDCINTCGEGKPIEVDCHAEPDSGPCDGHYKRYYYDPSTNCCFKFIYGGCDGNTNNFKSEKECLAKCGKPVEVKCHAKPDKGPCDGHYKRYFYDPSKNCCLKFIYGGCGGNTNNFKSEKECLAKCGKSVEIDCHAKPDKGPCDGHYKRYYYDKSKNCCLKFIYGGCGGNGNNFKSEKECLAKCGKPVEVDCHAKPDKGPCDGHYKRYYYDKSKNCCLKFIYGGCGGNGNNFKSEKECLAKCGKPVEIDCHAKPDKGPCDGHYKRYYYDKSKNCCLKFIYGGCGGNGNNFKSEKECLDKCSKPVEVDCHAKPDKGPCDGHYKRYYYDKSKNCCFKFIYGGCGGNGNNFKSEKECLAKCSKPVEIDCHAEPDKGPCDGHYKRYYYDASKNCCLKFIYGGCDGNGNNFKSEKECLAKCGKPVEIDCHAKPDKGPCNGHYKRYYYDSSKNCCLKFIYGGCGGNGNNFKSEKECLEKCSKPAEINCLAEPDCGPCDGYFERYYYDPFQNCCFKFIYGGCGGNTNNFKSEKECLAKCDIFSTSNPVEVNCLAEPDSGPCYGYFERYYYDPFENCCFKFIYGGCAGNTNNFESEKECLSKCRI